MTTYGFRFRDSGLDIWVGHRGVERYIATQYDIRENEWNKATAALIIPPGNSARRRKLLNYQRGMERNMRMLENIIAETDHRRCSVDDIVNAFRSQLLGNQMLGIYAAILAHELEKAGQPRTARGYISTVRRFIEFNRGHDMRLDDITLNTINAFQASLKREELSLNTLSFYMRTLRAIYNKAIAERLISPRLENPFEMAEA